jgi:hypothetical protein
MDIYIKTVPNEQIKERHGFTGADWWYDENGDLQVRVAEMSSWDREMKLAVHEMVEAILCKKHGVTVAQVDEFDTQFEKDHPTNHGIEAGDSLGCPYLREHNAAIACERIVASELGPDPWILYDAELAKL